MSGGPSCICNLKTLEDKKTKWSILTYKGNHSAFNGYRFEPSDYSCLRCRQCGYVWRTKAAYVEKLT